MLSRLLDAGEWLVEFFFENVVAVVAFAALGVGIAFSFWVNPGLGLLLALPAGLLAIVFLVAIFDFPAWPPR